MPFLCEIKNYSEHDTIRIFNNYYSFLTKIYLSESDVVKAPPSGWEGLKEKLHNLGKSEEMCSLLSRLPYIREDRSDNLPMVGANMYFKDLRDVSLVTEANPRLDGFLYPPHMIPLTCPYPWDAALVIMDIKRAVIYWHENPPSININASKDMIFDDPYDYCDTVEEADWIASSRAWAIEDFFQMLVGQFRDLHFLPTTNKTVIGDWLQILDDLTRDVKQVYRLQGWPDLDGFDKEGCLDFLKHHLNENYPEVNQYYDHY